MAGNNETISCFIEETSLSQISTVSKILGEKQKQKQKQCKLDCEDRIKERKIENGIVICRLELICHFVW